MEKNERNEWLDDLFKSSYSVDLKMKTRLEVEGTASLTTSEFDKIKKIFDEIEDEKQKLEDNFVKDLYEVIKEYDKRTAEKLLENGLPTEIICGRNSFQAFVQIKNIVPVKCSELMDETAVIFSWV